MADRFSRCPAIDGATERRAWRATTELLAKIAAQRRRERRWARFRSGDLLVDLLVAMATYAGLTVAVVLGAIYGIWAMIGLVAG